MKILFVDKQEKTAAGMGTYSDEVIRILTRRGQQIIPLRYGDQPQESDPKNTILLPYLVGNKAVYFIPRRKTFDVVRKVIEEQKPDVVHLSMALSPFDFYIPKLCHDHKIPVVGILHAGFPPGKTTNFTTLGVKSVFISYLPCLMQLDRIIVFSQAVADFLRDKKINPEKICIIPNSVDINLYSPGGSRFKNKNKIKFAFLFLGRLDRQKNPDLLIKSFLALNPPPEQKLIIVGKGTMGLLGDRLMEEYKKHPQIIFTGAITDPKQKVDIIRAANVFVQPSSFEGMSFSLLETMSCELAPICSDVGNHAEVIGDSGIIISCDLIEEQLPVALQIFSKSPSYAKILGKKARGVILQKYNLEKQVENLIKIYKEVSETRKKFIPRPSIFQRIFKLG